VKLLTGNLGRAVIKVSAVKEIHQSVRAPAVVFDDQNQIAEKFEAGELNKDFIAVVRFQGPKANGMPELHKLTPFLGSLQDKGYKVALVTDGRMSGASGKVPAAIHLWPEACEGGLIAKIENGDMISVDAQNGELTLEVSAEQLSARSLANKDLVDSSQSMGRELFAPMRAQVNCAELGASVF
jgi:phosphogluconate dehydratase